MFLKQQISKLELFLKDHATIKSGLIYMKMQHCIKIINYILSYILIEKEWFKIVAIT